MTTMKYGSVEGIANPISRLVLGTMVCTTDDQEAANRLLDAWVEAGGNCLDTAHIYGGGKSERAIGQWFQARGNRSDIILLDKGAHPYGSGPRVNPDDIDKDISESLERLQTDFIDIYLLHRDDPEFPVGPIVEALNVQRNNRRIGIFGGSNWSPERIQAANDYANEYGLEPFSASSPNLSLAVASEPMWGGCVTLDAAGKQWHTQHQFPLFAWSSQSGGFFTDRFAPDKTDNKDMVRCYYNDANWERKHRAGELAAQKGATPNQIALAWVLHQPFPTFPLIGPRNPDELHDSLPALDIALTDAEQRYLNLETDTI